MIIKKAVSELRRPSLFWLLIFRCAAPLCSTINAFLQISWCSAPNDNIFKFIYEGANSRITDYIWKSLFAQFQVSLASIKLVGLTTSAIKMLIHTIEQLGKRQRLRRAQSSRRVIVVEMPFKILTKGAEHRNISSNDYKKRRPFQLRNGLLCLN